jgi:hypothetical protein
VAHGTKFWCTTSRIGVPFMRDGIYILGPRLLKSRFYLESLGGFCESNRRIES